MSDWPTWDLDPFDDEVVETVNGLSANITKPSLDWSQPYEKNIVMERAFEKMSSVSEAFGGRSVSSKGDIAKAYDTVDDYRAKGLPLPDTKLNFSFVIRIVCVHCGEIDFGTIDPKLLTYFKSDMHLSNSDTGEDFEVVEKGRPVIMADDAVAWERDHYWKVHGEFYYDEGTVPVIQMAGISRFAMLPVDVIKRIADAHERATGVVIQAMHKLQSDVEDIFDEAEWKLRVIKEMQGVRVGLSE